jgi:anti-sigma factor RsiW
MCDFSGKLITWLDRELPAEAAAEVQRHLELCAECRSRVEEYRHVTTAFERYCDAYCEAGVASRLNRKQRRRVVARWEAAALAAAAIAAIFLFVARAHVELSPAGAAPAMATSPASSVVSQTNQPADGRQNRRPMNVSAGQSGQTSASPQDYGASGLPGDAAVEIAIPADAILPPGAVPEGVSFGADVTIAPDGSAQQIRLTPLLTEFERRSTLP